MIWLTASALVIAGGAAAVGFGTGWLKEIANRINVEDYPGPGTGSLSFVIEEGDTGESIARSLVALDVVKDFTTFYRILLNRNPVFYPGTYELKYQMSALGALDALTSSGNQVLNRVTIREGLRLYQVFRELSAATGIPEADFEAAAADPGSFGAPSDAPSLEGYLFPATYEFEPDLTAREVLTIMAKRMQKELDSYGVSASEKHEVLTLASLIQAEARFIEDFYRVSRVIQNRLDEGMLLQFDSTVTYAVRSGKITTSAEERANDNPYNTYLYPGLPIGPIGNPGSDAIDAALNPAKGPWFYFVTVNLETGETVFSKTLAQHESAVLLFQQWLRDHPEWQ